MSKETSQLYAAATEALVSDASATSTFEKMISVAYGHKTLDIFVADVHDTEAKVKSEFEITSMPNPWRSAKSVITTAMRMNLALIDDNGSYCGKSFLQNKIKEIKNKDKVEQDEEAFANSIIAKIINSSVTLNRKEIVAFVIHYFTSIGLC